jgi:3-oxoacyl-[acyl-carrier protein] reductase
MAPLRAMRAAIPGMAERGWGRVVNVCSTSGKRPSALMPEYSVAKAAELSLSRLFADLYAEQGVLVNAVCPGPIETAMTRGFDYAVAGQPIARMGQPADVAQAVVFFASQMSNFVTGQTLNVDGGILMD